MKTKGLVFSNISMAVVLTAIVVSAYAFTFTKAFAATVPTVNVSINNESNANVTSVPVGTVVHLNTSVSSSTGPIATGTVDFSSYQNTTCSGTATVQTGVALVNGSANSATTTVGNNGLSYKASYVATGDVYASTTSSCVSVNSTSNAVSLNSTLSSSSILVGGSVSQSATLSGVTANATGTVAYSVYSNSSCNADKQDAGVKTVSNGTVASSNSMTFSTAGTKYFQAVYSGDQFNSGATGQCQSFSINNPPTPTPTGTGSISGTAFNDLNKNKTKDSGEAGIGGFTVKLYGGTFWWNWGKPRAVATTTTDSNGNYSFIGLADGIYRVEETKLAGWAQISGDFRWVLVVNGKSLTGLDFANISKASGSGTATSSPNKKDKDEKRERKEEKREEHKEKKINKLMEKINKIENKGKGNGRDD